MKTILTLTAGALLAGFAPAPEFPAPGEEVHASMTGWVRFENGEFQLYGDEDQVLQPFSSPCLSGAASRNEMRQARQDLNNAKVTIAGRVMSWSERDGRRIRHRGSIIRNDCGGRLVILADDIRPAN
ncbi:MAG: hypothetical protein M3Q74_08985 [Pseudomonadota bacterium]|nr:hypothetical protein [Pseudomonadota bacterium]